MRTVNFSEARNNLKAVFDRVVDDADVTIVTRRDAEDVVVMSLAEWNSWKETDYLLSSPANAKRLLQAFADLDTGKRVVRELIEPHRPAQVSEPRAEYRVKPATKRKPARALGKRRG